MSVMLNELNLSEIYLYFHLNQINSHVSHDHLDMIESAYRDEHEASLIIGEAESSLFDLSGNKDDKFPDWKDSVRSAFTDIENQDPNELISGVTTGYIGLNERLGGLKPTDMIVIAARPAMGKTSLALNIAENAALGLHGEPTPVGVFSLEMSREQLVKRMLFFRMPSYLQSE